MDYMNMGRDELLRHVSEHMSTPEKPVYSPELVRQLLIDVRVLEREVGLLRDRESTLKGENYDQESRRVKAEQELFYYKLRLEQLGN